MKKTIEELAREYIQSIAGTDPNTDISLFENEYNAFMAGANAVKNNVDLADGGGSLPKVKIERYRLRDVDEEKYLSEMERLGFEFITFDTKIEDASDRFRYYYFRHFN